MILQAYFGGKLMKTIILSLALCLSTTLAHANILQLTPGTETKAGVTISTGGIAMVKGVQHSLVTVGSGIRVKYLIGSIGTKVYVAQILVTDPNSYNKADGLKSVAAQSASALVLSFVTTVPANKVYSSFEDGLVTNNVDTSAQDVSAFLNAVNSAGEAANGKNLTLLFVKNADGSETLSYEHTNGNVVEITGPAGLAEKILSIWLGTPVDGDDGLAELKAELLK